MPFLKKNSFSNSSKQIIQDRLKYILISFLTGRLELTSLKRDLYVFLNSMKRYLKNQPNKRHLRPV